MKDHTTHSSEGSCSLKEEQSVTSYGHTAKKTARSSQSLFKAALYGLALIGLLTVCTVFKVIFIDKPVYLTPVEQRFMDHALDTGRKCSNKTSSYAGGY